MYVGFIKMLIFHVDKHTEFRQQGVDVVEIFILY